MNNKTGNEENIPKEIGSNLTGTAVHAKPGHLRDIPIDKYVMESDDETSNNNSLETIKKSEEELNTKKKENKSKGS